jgi:hypothetical protein
MENNICGFIELNGELVKISSVEDLKDLAARLGSAFTELSVKDYEKFCEKLNGDYELDDCGVFYSKDGKRLLFAPITSDEYLIKTGTIAISSYAFNWHSYQSGGTLYTNCNAHEKIINRVFIPSSVIAIGSKAFCDNTAIEKIIVSSNLEYIGNNAFSGCWKMSGFTIPSSIKYIESEAFDGCCNAFAELVFPESMKHIGSHAFRGCTQLEKVTFMSEIENIGSGIFDGCEKLVKIVVPQGASEKFRGQLPFYADIITENEDVLSID